MHILHFVRTSSNFFCSSAEGIAKSSTAQTGAALLIPTAAAVAAVEIMTQEAEFTKARRLLVSL